MRRYALPPVAGGLVVGATLAVWWAAGTPIPAVRAVSLGATLGALLAGARLGRTVPTDAERLDRIESAVGVLSVPVFFLIVLDVGGWIGDVVLAVLVPAAGLALGYVVASRIDESDGSPGPIEAG